MFRPVSLFACAALGALFHTSVDAAAVAFQDPATAAWGDWTRGSAGSAYVHYDRFRNEPDIGVAPVLPDSTPDRGALGLAANNGSILVTGKKGSTAQPAAFITGSGNIYSFNDELAFQLVVSPASAHTALGVRPITAALQVSALGADIDHASVRLNGAAWSQRVTLATGNSSAPGGTDGGTGVDNEYLYLWELPVALGTYAFAFAAADTSLSLDAVAVDIGPQAVAGGPGGSGGTGSTQPVPLPAGWLLVASAGMLLRRARRRG
ncbi:MAG: hypothetical protein RLW61_05685 [Gammaproteobacteria bacterium]